MPRVVSLFLPMWPTDRFRRKSGDAAPPPETPLVLVGRDGRRRVVLAADAAAHAAGLRIGMPASKAQALVPGLVVHDAEPEADDDRARAIGAVGAAPLCADRRRRSAGRPRDRHDRRRSSAWRRGGDAHRDGGRGLAAPAYAARAAVADSWGAAHALARFGTRQTLVVPSGEIAQAILPLPIAALRLPAVTIDSLRRLGFETIADLAGTPRASLALRFGPEPGRRLDQAFGRVSEPIEPIRPEEIVEVRRNFAEPIGAAETIARYTGKLVAELCAALETRGLGARRLDLLFFRVDNRVEAIRVGTAMPVRDVKRLTRLLTDKIETIDPGFGIELMRLAATVAEPLRAKQMISSLAEAPEPDVSDVIDILANRVGEDRLYRFAPVQSDVPERSVQRIAPMAPDTGEGWPGHWPRPSRLLPRPEPIETVALLPDHPPVTFTWRGVRRRVKRADGPERVFGEWWKRDAELAAVRDYFQVEDENGERYWVYRAGDGEDAATGSHKWFMHGIFG